MKRLFLTVAICIGICIFIIADHMVVQAKEKYDVSDLDGTYYFVSIQVRAENGGIAHCSSFGDVTFDGAGTATISGVDRCDGVNGPPYTHYDDYTVNSTGLVEITDQYGDTTQCQILDKGHMLLCDGSTRTSDTKSWIAIGVLK